MTLNKTSLVTAALTAALPFIADILIFGTTDRASRIFEDPAILVFNAVFAAAPFILIGLVMKPRRSVTRALWTAFILTALLWGIYAFTGWRYHVSALGGGANIGLYMLLMVWPFICAIIMGIVARFRPISSS